jgi:Outer membrane protein beta-barrel domain
MKKFVVLILAVAVVPAAQAAVFKVFLGPVMSTYSGGWPNSAFPGSPALTGNLNPFHSHRTGNANGLGVEFPIARGFSLEIDGGYFSTGAKLTFPTEDSATGREAYTLQALGFPVFFKFLPLPRYYPYFLVGAQFSLILSHSRTSYVRQAGGPFFEEILEEDLSDATGTFDFGPVAGIGFDFPLVKWAFFVQVRYCLGVVDLIKGIPGLGHAARARTFAIAVGYKL